MVEQQLPKLNTRVRFPSPAPATFSKKYDVQYSLLLQRFCRGTHDVTTVGGCILKARESKGKITLTDEMGGVAHVTIADVKQSNGVIHVIDKVLLPKM